MRFIINYSWAILWAIFILVLMIRPASDFSKTSVFEGFDKLAHAGFFFVFTVLSYFGSVLHSQRRAMKFKTSVFIILIGIAFAFLTEGMQYYCTSTRHADWWDVFADVVGIGMGTFAYLLLHQKRN